MRAWRALVGKEIRAVASPAAGALAVMIAAGLVLSSRILDALAVLTYVVAPLALGAMVVGHEYTHRTLATQLTLPLPRRHLLIAKGLVLAVTLLALGLAAEWAIEVRVGHAGYGARVSAHESGFSVLLLPLACGFCLAPAFTILAKNTLAGMVFAAAAPASFWIAGEVAGVSELGFLPTDHRLLIAIKVAWLRIGVIASCAASVIGLAVVFPRLEVAGGRASRAPHLRPTRSSSAAHGAVWIEPRRRSVWSQLVLKELRLQQITLVVAGLYLLFCLPLLKLQSRLPGFFSDSAAAVTYVYGFFLAMLAGSLASAEERQLGTLELQTLLPVAGWKQWLIKLTTALALAIGLGVAAPFLLASTLNSSDLVLITHGREFPEFAAGCVLLMVASLYVSSMTSSGIRALILSFAGIALVIAIGSAVAVTVGPLAYGVMERELLRGTLPSVGPEEIGALMSAGRLIAVLAAACLVCWICWLAMRNHRLAYRSAVAVGRQCVAVASLIVTGVVLWTVLTVAVQVLRHAYLLRLRGR